MFPEDYDELSNRVFNPIYPDEEHREFNAHIKARALAGCYPDKKRYVFQGARNSEKGVETSLLRGTPPADGPVLGRARLTHVGSGNP